MAGGSQFLLNFIVLSRTITVYLKSDDFMYRLQFYCGLTLNTSLSTQFIYMNYCRRKQQSLNTVGEAEEQKEVAGKSKSKEKT